MPNPARRSLREIGWIADLAVVAAILFGVMVILQPSWVGLEVIEASAAATGGHTTTSGPWFLFPLILLTILLCAFRASRHAERFAHLLREPFGVLILTLSAVTIEVALVIGVMLTGPQQDDVARNAMFAVLMMIMNGLVGIALVAGGLRKREQTFNVQSTNAFLALITGISFIGLVMPRLTVSRPGGYMTEQMELFVAGASLGVYFAFLVLQSSSHTQMFTHRADGDEMTATVEATDRSSKSGAIWNAVGWLVAALLGVVLLSHSLGGLLSTFFARRYLPGAFEGVVIALLVLLPEGIAAVRAALRSNVQRTVNILHGSALSTIGLTIPAILAVSLVMKRPVELGLSSPEIGLLAATIILSMLNVSLGKSNLMQGITHLMLFAMWIALLLD